MSLQTEDCGAIEITAEVRSLFKKAAAAEKAHDHSMHDHSGHDMHNMHKDGKHKDGMHK
ncbi:MAG: hypothetical protein HOM20_05300 [Porticoccaceae bacterium]|nr:hypothetical protein [Porticoccaceae bacterium]